MAYSKAGAIFVERVLSWAFDWELEVAELEVLRPSSALGNHYRAAERPQVQYCAAVAVGAGEGVAGEATARGDGEVVAADLAGEGRRVALEDGVARGLDAHVD